MKVWLSLEELQRLISHPDDTEEQIVYGLGGTCGLRSHEILQVRPSNVKDTDMGLMVAVPEGKGEKYREVPIPERLATQIKTIGDVRSSDQPVVSISTTRGIRKWIESTRRELAEETGNNDWLELTLHDLRRTWANQLSSCDVDALLVLEWGGWNDMDTFLDHYNGAYTPEGQRRERQKVDWL
jgi:integrase